jgi:hypothetical protein
MVVWFCSHVFVVHMYNLCICDTVKYILQEHFIFDEFCATWLSKIYKKKIRDKVANCFQTLYLVA